jgi:Fuc2NAc and GlcNAc transferase
MYLSICLILFLISCFGVRIYTSFAKHKGLLDTPNLRSSHKVPTPRGGGIVFIFLWEIVLIFFLVIDFIPKELFYYYFFPIMLIAIISFCDDNMKLSATLRFFIQTIAVTLAMLIIGKIPELNLGIILLRSHLLIFVLVLLFSLWSINLFNFMDGTDGLAAVQAIVIFLVGGLILNRFGAHDLSHVIWALMALLLGFLVWNWPKASIFMGDVGSATLGLIVILTATYAQKTDGVPFILWFMLYGAFLFDASITLVRRIIHKDKWYEAHNKHAYQRLHQSGLSHLQLLVGFIIVEFIISILTLLASYFLNLITIFVLLEFTMLCIIYLIIEKRLPMYSKLC